MCIAKIKDIGNIIVLIIILWLTKKSTPEWAAAKLKATLMNKVVSIKKISKLKSIFTGSRNGNGVSTVDKIGNILNNKSKNKCKTNSTTKILINISW